MRFLKQVTFLAHFFLLMAALPSHAVEYYVSNNGSDSRDGKTPATAWATIAKVNATVRARGADVFLDQTSTFRGEALVIDWDGSESDPVVIGCYRNSSGNAQTCNTFEQKPRLVGTLSKSCRDRKNCIANNSSAVPQSIHQGLININADYVTVRDIAVLDSAGRGITANGRATGRGEILHTNVENVTIKNTFFAPVVLENGVRFAKVRNSHVSYYNWCERNLRSDLVSACSNGGPWPGGIAIVRSKPSHSIIEGNTIFAGAGEGINCYLCSHVAIRDNRVGNNHSSTIYIDHGNHVVVEKNVIWGNPNNNNSFFRAGVSFEGIGVSLEGINVGNALAGGGDQILIRNNIIFGSAACFASRVEKAAGDAGLTVGGHIYGNTCISPVGKAVDFLLSSKHSSGWHVSNNIFYHHDSTLNCKAPSNTAFSNNYWTKRPTNKTCRGAGDTVGPVQFDAPKSVLAAVDFQNVPTPDDVIPLNREALKLRGSNSKADHQFLDLSDWTEVASEARQAGSSSCDKQFSVKSLPTDFYCNPRTSESDLFGAVVAGESSGNAPKPPLLIQ